MSGSSLSKGHSQCSSSWCRFLDGNELREMVSPKENTNLAFAEELVDNLLKDFDDDNDGMLSVKEFINSGV